MRGNFLGNFNEETLPNLFSFFKVVVSMLVHGIDARIDKSSLKQPE